MPSEMAYRKAFGSWSNAVKEAGFEPLKPFPSEKCKENMVKAHKGKRSMNWKGGEIKNNYGYVEVWMPEHPNANKSGYIRKHRLVMSDFLGRPLEDNEDVHHINGIKDDNRIGNLELIQKSEHAKFHEQNDKNKHERKIKVKCVYPSCEEFTSSKYCLCRNHYKLQWRRLKDGLVNKIHDFKEIPRKHTEETKNKLSDIAKRQKRKNGRFV